MEHDPWLTRFYISISKLLWIMNLYIYISTYLYRYISISNYRICIIWTSLYLIKVPFFRACPVPQGLRVAAATGRPRWPNVAGQQRDAPCWTWRWKKTQQFMQIAKWFSGLSMFIRSLSKLNYKSIRFQHVSISVMQDLQPSTVCPEDLCEQHEIWKGIDQNRTVLPAAVWIRNIWIWYNLIIWH